MEAVIGKDIDKAKAFLEEGELVAIPTETVYGLAANAFDAQAAAKIFEAKNRPSFDPLIVHTSGVERIGAFARIPDELRGLAEAFWPGPMTLLLEKKDVIPDLVNSGLERVAVRIPDHPLTRRLLESLDFPLAAPSANPFGYVSPTCARHVHDQLGEKISYILDGGHSDVGLESTIIGIENGKPTVFRLGGLSVEKIEAVVGKVEVRAHSSSNPQAPGMLKSHYSPMKPVVLGDIGEELAKRDPREVGILSFEKVYAGVPRENQFVLSESGDLVEAAARLFQGLRALDGKGVRVILTELMPERGLGRAMNDRLRRSAV